MLRVALVLCGVGLPAPAPVEDGTAPDWATDIESWESDEAPAEPQADAPADPEAEDDARAAGPLAPRRRARLRESITGSLRIVVGFLRFPDEPAFFPERNDGFLATEARLIGARDFSEHVDVELNAFIDLTRSPGSLLGGAFATAGSITTPYRAEIMELTAGEGSPVQMRLGLDRARVGVHKGRVTFDLGRFPLNFAVAQLFTPNDFFAPFSATAINRIYKPGVDAARLGVALGKRGSLEVASVMGIRDAYTPSWGRSAIIVRPSIVAWNFEWALIGGKVAERWVVGGSLQGDAGPIGLRGEGHVGLPDREGDGPDDDRDVHVRLSAGPNVNFAWQSTTLAAEYAYFSDGEIQPARYIDRFARRFPDDLPYLGRHYVALLAGLETIPILRLNATAIVNAHDGSGLAGLFLAWSIADEADLLIGGFLPWGRGPDPDAAAPVLRSEYGLQPATLFLETRVFF